MTWQELHSGCLGGPLVDYKRGPGHATYPSEQVGTWTILSGSPDKVRHDCGSGNVFDYEVHGSGIVGDIHNFCGATNVEVKIKSGGC